MADDVETLVECTEIDGKGIGAGAAQCRTWLRVPARGHRLSWRIPGVGKRSAVSNRVEDFRKLNRTWWLVVGHSRQPPSVAKASQAGTLEA